MPVPSHAFADLVERLDVLEVTLVELDDERDLVHVQAVGTQVRLEVAIGVGVGRC